MKKRWLTIGGVVAGLVPIATVISCGGSAVTGSNPKPTGPTAEELQSKQDAKDKTYLQAAKSHLEDTAIKKVDQKPSMVLESGKALLDLFYYLNHQVLTSKFQGVIITAQTINQNDANGSLLLNITLKKGTQQVTFKKEILNLLTTSSFIDYEDEKWFEDRKINHDNGSYEYQLSVVENSWSHMSQSEWDALPINNNDRGEAVWNNNFTTENEDDNIVIDKTKLLEALDNYAGLKKLPIELDDPRNEVLTAKYHSYDLSPNKQKTIKGKNILRGIEIMLRLKRGNIIKNNVAIFIMGFK